VGFFRMELQLLQPINGSCPKSLYVEAFASLGPIIETAEIPVSAIEHDNRVEIIILSIKTSPKLDGLELLVRTINKGNI